MKRKRSILIFWALFLVPTLIITVAALNMLSHEQERINRSAVQSLTDRAEAISDTIHLTIETIQNNLSLSLQDLDEKTLKDKLIEWEESNPLVRNVFIFNSLKQLEYPVRGMESTLEERRFIARYEPFFSGRERFDIYADRIEDGSKREKAADTLKGATLYSSVPQDRKQSSRQKLLALSRVQGKAAPARVSPDELETAAPQWTTKSGWVPWFSENRLYILGWVQKSMNGPVFGIELELMTLLSRLVVDFPAISEKGAALVLMDGNGSFMHQSGDLLMDTGKTPIEVLSISSLLPHWQIAVFMDDKGVGSTRGFLYLSILLLAVFITAIVSGGILLTRLTLQNMKDARQKTSFVSSVSHELKTPLTSIRMYAELLLSERIKDKKKTRTYLSVIVSESSRLTRLINNILDFGKLEQGRKTYQISEFELDRMLHQIIEAHSIRMKDQGFRILTEVESGSFKVKTDRDAVEQVVLNLLDNAVKYADQGTFIKFVLLKEHQDILLKICDDGPGIPKEQKKKIFQKFHRVDNSLTARQPGSGLGLSIARQIMKDLNGDLLFEPMPGTGSCFIIRMTHDDQD